MRKILLLNSYNQVLPRTLHILNTLKKQEFDITLINWARDVDFKPVEKSDIETHTVVLSLGKRLSNKVSFIPKYFRKVKQLIGGRRFDFIYCNHIIFLPMAVYLSIRSGGKVIYDTPEFYLEHFKMKLPKGLKFCSGFLYCIESLCLLRTQSVFTIDSVNNFYLNRYKKLVKKTVVLNNVPANDKSINFDVKRLLDEKYKNFDVILYIGGLSHENGALKTLEAATHLIDSHPNILFLFIGRFNSSLKEESFLQYITDNKLENHVEMIPWIPYNELFCYADSVKVGLSVYQHYAVYKRIGATNSRKLFTYMKMGIPIIAPSFGRQGECIKNENCGLVLDTSSATEISNGISYLLNNPAEANEMARHAEMAFKEKYNWNIEEQKLLKFIQA